MKITNKPTTKEEIEIIFQTPNEQPNSIIEELVKIYKDMNDDEKKLFSSAVISSIKEKLKNIESYRQIKSESDKKEVKKTFDDIKIRLSLLSKIRVDNYYDIFVETYNLMAKTLEKLEENRTKKILLNKLKNIYEKLLINLQYENSNFLRKKENELLKLAGKENEISRKKMINEYIENIKAKKYNQNKLQDLIHTRDRYIAILKARSNYLTDEEEKNNNQSEIDIESELQQAVKNFYTNNFGEIVEKEQYLPLIDGSGNSEQAQDNQSSQENDDDKKYKQAVDEYKKAKEAYQNIKKEITNLEEQIKNASQEEIESLNQRKELQEKELKEKKADLFLARGRLISISKERYKQGHTNIKRNIYELLKEHIEDIEYYIKLNKNEKNMPAHIGITSEFVWKIEKANASLSLLKYAEVEDKVNNLGGTIKNVVSPIGTLLKVPIIVPLKLGSKALSTIGQIVVQPIDMIYTPIGKLIHFDSKYNTQKIQDAGKRLGEILATPTNALESTIRKI